MTREKVKVWIFSFEYAGIAKVGGLGEVPANQAKYLKNDFEVTVFLPSHGQIEQLKGVTELEKLPFTSKHQVDFNQDGITELKFSCEISYFKCKLNGINIILLSGENSTTSKYIDDPIVYNPETLSCKILIYSIGLRLYVRNIVENGGNTLPSIVHMHDYHVVIPFISIKQELMKNGMDVASLITIHLLTWPRYGIDFYYACGINRAPIKTLLNEGFKSLTIQEIFDLCKDSQKAGEEYNPPSVEKIGAICSDLVTTVSKSYLYSDIIPNLGKSLIDFKSDFVWDGCDWDYEETYKNVIDKLGNEICEVLQIPNKSLITKTHMKDYLLTYKINHLKQSPLIKSEKVLSAINEISNGDPFIKNGVIKAFDKSGPLVIATGRISHQKGFETILEAIPEVIQIIPKAKFLLLLLPTEYSLNEIKKYAQFVKKYPKNLRIVFGIAAEIFQIAHIGADAYCALSRWEPFGIIALEAMASKLPVIATKVGGLQESVIDIRKDPENGTGILINKDNPSEFAKMLINLLLLAELSERFKDSNGNEEREKLKIINLIPDELLKSYAIRDIDFYTKIRENCIKRVNTNFRWNIVTKKLISLYKKLLELF